MSEVHDITHRVAVDNRPNSEIEVQSTSRTTAVKLLSIEMEALPTRFKQVMISMPVNERNASTMGGVTRTRSLRTFCYSSSPPNSASHHIIILYTSSTSWFGCIVSARVIISSYCCIHLSPHTCPPVYYRTSRRPPRKDTSESSYPAKTRSRARTCECPGGLLAAAMDVTPPDRAVGERATRRRAYSTELTPPCPAPEATWAVRASSLNKRENTCHTPMDERQRRCCIPSRR